MRAGLVASLAHPGGNLTGLHIPCARAGSALGVRLSQDRRERVRVVLRQDNRAAAADYISTRLLSTIFLDTN